MSQSCSIPPVNQFFPPVLSFIEKHKEDITEKVVIATDATSRVGFEAANVLYSKNATVYIAARSADKANNAIASIQNATECARSCERPVFLLLDLADLDTIK